MTFQHRIRVTICAIALTIALGVLLKEIIIADDLMFFVAAIISIASVYSYEVFIARRHPDFTVGENNTKDNEE